MFTEYFYFMLNRKWIARYGVTRKGIRQRRWIFVVQRYFAWTHCYRNANLFRLENLCCPGFPTGNARPGQNGVVLLSRVWQQGQKVLPAPRGWLILLSRFWDKMSPFFFLFSFSQFFFYFNYTFAFQLNLFIGIQCVWSPLIYIYSYLYNICPR